MAEQDPLDSAFSEIANILEFLQKNKDRLENKDIPFALEQQIEQLEQKVKKFAKETNELLSKSGGDASAIKQVLEELPASIPEDQREALKRAKQMKEKILKMREEFAADASLASSGPVEEKTKKEKKLSKTEHLKKYKRLGGKKDWKPM